MSHLIKINKMKKQLLIKLSAFIITAMLFSASANAQIIYTDVNPDVVKTCSVGSSGTCSGMDSIDINNDGVFDLKLNLGANWVVGAHGSSTRSGYVRATPLNGSAIITDTAGYPYPLYMNLNDVIGIGNSTSMVLGLILFSKSILSPTGTTTSSGNWITATDGFLGLKIVSGNQTYFGWVRLNVALTIGAPSSATYTIKDYAYNSIPNQPILAGQTTATGIIESSFASSLNLFPNPATNNLTITLASSSKKVNVSIIDITGEIIYKTTVRETQKIEVKTEDFKSGIYVVQIQTADFIVTKKLIIEK